MTLRERIQRLCKLNGTSLNQVETELGFGKGYLSKLQNSTPNAKKMEQVANYLGVTIDFLMGKTEKTKCNICGQSYDPLDEFDRDIHEMYHKKFINAKDHFSFFIDDFLRCGLMQNDEYQKFTNTDLSFKERMTAYDNYLKAKFSSDIAFLDYNIDEKDYEEFCKSEVSLLEPTSQITSDLILEIAKKYDVDIKMLDLNNKLLSRASKNPKIMNIIRYALEMDDQQLCYAEKAVKSFIS